MPPLAVTADSIDYGKVMVGGLLEEKRHSRCSTKITNEQDMVLKTFRLLVADLCQQFGGGHPGYEYPILGLSTDANAYSIGVQLAWLP